MRGREGGKDVKLLNAKRCGVKRGPGKLLMGGVHKFDYLRLLRLVLCLKF